MGKDRWFGDGNIRLHVADKEIQRGIDKMLADQADFLKYQKAAKDPEAPYTNPDDHATRRNVTKRWKPSVQVRKAKNQVCKVSYMPYRNEQGLMVQPGITDDEVRDRIRAKLAQRG